MSTWDHYRKAHKVHERGTSSIAQANTLFLPSDSMSLTRTLAGEQRCASSLGEVHDLARFVEDFVLCERVGLPGGLCELVGPYFIGHYSWDDFPLVSTHGIATELERRAGLSKHPDLDLDVCDNLSSDQVRLRLSSVEETNRWLLAASMFREIGETKLTSGDDRESFWQWRGTAPGRFAELPVLLRSMGASASPGWVYREYFLNDQPDLQRYLYDAVSAQFAADLRLIEDFQPSVHVPVPPLLTILLARSSSAKNLVPELVGMRSEFAEARAVSAAYSTQLAAAGTIRQSLAVVREMQRARAAIVQRIGHQGKELSTVRRVWDVVKAASLPSILTGFADLLLKWDEERVAVSSVRAFVDMYRLATEVRSAPARYAAVFGEIRE